MIEWITQADFAVLYWIREHLCCGFLDAVMPVLSDSMNAGIPCILLAAVLLCVPKTRRTGLAIGIALASGFLFGNMVVKSVVARVRPYEVDTLIELLVERLSDFSFPSGHAIACFGTATVLTVRHRKAGVAALVLAALVAFSRLYLFVHYPTDVLAGTVIGVGAGLFGCKLAGLLCDAIARRWHSRRFRS